MGGIASSGKGSGRRFAEVVATTTLTNLLLMALGLLTGIVCARMLGPTGNGELTSIRAWGSIVGAVSSLGMYTALVYYAARSPEASSSWVGSARVVAVATTSLGALLGAALMPGILREQSSEVVGAAVIFMLIGPIEAALWIGMHALRGLGRFGAWNAVRAVPGLVWVAVLGFGWILGWGAAGLADAMVAGMFCCGIGVTIFARNMIPGRWRIEPICIRPLTRFGLPAMASTLPQTLNARVDLLLVTAFLPAERVGLYAVAASVAAVVPPLVSSIGSVLFPRVAEERIRSQQCLLFEGVCQVAILPVAVLTILSAIAASVLIPIVYGSLYGEAIRAGVILCIAAGILSFADIVSEGLRGLNLQRALIIGYVVGALATGLVILVARDGFSLELAAGGALLGNMITLVVLVFASGRAVGSTWRAFLRPRLPEMAVLRPSSWR